ncbi:unnamed protein product, partial [Agarophyton chilense]
VRRTRRRPFRRPGRRPGGFDDGDDQDQNQDQDEEFAEQADADAAQDAGDASDASDADDADDDLCFPAHAVVNTLQRGPVRMHHLRVGDLVEVASTASASTASASTASPSPKRYSAVFTFSHRVPAPSLFPFVHLRTANGSLELSAAHYVHTAVGTFPARAVRVDDLLQLADHSLAAVLDVRHVWRHGLYNPHTVLGELVVDGFRVSSYTTSVSPVLANALLAPVRVVFTVLRVDMTRGLLSHARARWVWTLVRSASA